MRPLLSLVRQLGTHNGGEWTLARFRWPLSSEGTSSKTAQMRRADWAGKGLLLGVDRTYSGHHETRV